MLFVGEGAIEKHVSSIFSKLRAAARRGSLRRVPPSSTTWKVPRETTLDVPPVLVRRCPPSASVDRFGLRGVGLLLAVICIVFGTDDAVEPAVAALADAPT